MHYVNFKEKNRTAMIRFGVYLLMGALAMGITFGIVFAARGYDIDRNTGAIIQNGLVLIESQPAPANIVVDGQGEGRTPGRLPIPAGRYQIELNELGYQEWSKQVVLQGSDIVSLDYVRMFPEVFDENAIASFNKSITQWLPSDDSRFLAISGATKPLSIAIYDTNQPDQAPNVLSINKSQLTLNKKKLGELAFEGWNASGTWLLVRHSYKDFSEFVLIENKDDGRAIPISRRTENKFDDIKFADRENLVFYILRNQNLRRFDLLNDSLSGILVSDVIEFNSNDASAVAVTVSGLRYELVAVEGLQAKQLHTSSDKLTQATTWRFDGTTYYAVERDGATWLFFNNSKPNPIRRLSINNSRAVGPSPRGAYFMAENDSLFAILDIGQLKVLQFAGVDSQESSTAWLNNSQVSYYSAEGIHEVMDFDGANVQQITSDQASDYPAVLSPNGEYVIFASGKDGSNDAAVFYYPTTVPKR